MRFIQAKHADAYITRHTCTDEDVMITDRDTIAALKGALDVAKAEAAANFAAGQHIAADREALTIEISDAWKALGIVLPWDETLGHAIKRLRAERDAASQSLTALHLDVAQAWNVVGRGGERSFSEAVKRFAKCFADKIATIRDNERDAMTQMEELWDIIGRPLVASAKRLIEDRKSLERERDNLSARLTEDHAEYATEIAAWRERNAQLVRGLADERSARAIEAEIRERVRRDDADEVAELCAQLDDAKHRLVAMTKIATDAHQNWRQAVASVPDTAQAPVPDVAFDRLTTFKPELIRTLLAKRRESFASSTTNVERDSLAFEIQDLMAELERRNDIERKARQGS